MLSQEIAQQKTMATIFPIIFLGVAVFLLHMVLSRQVATQREHIAALKALGIESVEDLLYHFPRDWQDRSKLIPIAAAKPGETITLGGQPHTIVGVLSPAFTVPFLDADVFTPLVASPEPVPRQPVRTVVAVAELAPGVSLEQARDELSRISDQLAQEFPRTHAFWMLGVEDVREWQYGPMRAALLALE